MSGWIYYLFLFYTTNKSQPIYSFGNFNYQGRFSDTSFLKKNKFNIYWTIYETLKQNEWYIKGS